MSFDPRSSDELLRSSGQMVAYAENATGTATTIPAAAFIDIPGCSITVGPTVRPLWIKGRAYVDLTATPIAGTTTNLQLYLMDELDATIDGTSVPIESNGVATGFADLKFETHIGVLAVPKTYRLRAYRSATTGFTANVMNAAGAGKSWIAGFLH